VVVEADGGSRGNPGPAGYGAVVLDPATGSVLAERAEAIGTATNNVAEYSGLLAGLEAARELGAREVDVRMDSKLVVEQMSGRWKVKHPAMVPLAAQAATLVRGFDRVRFSWVPRERNRAADALANSAMDGRPVRTGPSGAAAGTVGPDGLGEQDPLDLGPAPGLSDAPVPGWGQPTQTATTTVLVRHGASVLSPERRFSGRGDVPLSPEGSAQAALVAARLVRRGGVHAVVTSPLRRARRTAEAVASALGLDLAIDDDLVETDFGDWEGHTFAEVRERWPAELDAWLASPDVAPPGGESFTATTERVLRARDRLLAAHPERTVAVVAHVGPLKTLLRLALEAPPASMYRMHLDLTGVSEVDWYADGPATVRLLNDAHHLAP